MPATKMPATRVDRHRLLVRSSLTIRKTHVLSYARPRRRPRPHTVARRRVRYGPTTFPSARQGPRDGGATSTYPRKAKAGGHTTLAAHREQPHRDTACNASIPPGESESHDITRPASACARNSARQRWYASRIDDRKAAKDQPPSAPRPGRRKRKPSHTTIRSGGLSPLPDEHRRPHDRVICPGSSGRPEATRERSSWGGLRA